MMPRPESAARGWWMDMQPGPAQGRPGNRMALARLRRCATVAEAMQEPSTLLLFQLVEATRPAQLPDVALTAAVLAHVRTDGAIAHPGRSVARQVGPDTIESPETALLKPLRFRRLMEADGWDDRLIAFRRLVAIAKGDLPVRDLAAALLHWTDNRRRRWVFDYWNPASPADQPHAESKDLPA